MATYWGGPPTHGARGIGKHYHLRFDPKLGMGKCAIFFLKFLLCILIT